jgi:hypothetical protein
LDIGNWELGIDAISAAPYRSRVLADILFSVACEKNDSHCVRIRSSFDTCPESTLRPALTM